MGRTPMGSAPPENPAAARAVPCTPRDRACRPGDPAPATAADPPDACSWELSKDAQPGKGIPGIGMRSLQISRAGGHGVAVGATAHLRVGAGQYPLLGISHRVVQAPPV